MNTFLIILSIIGIILGLFLLFKRYGSNSFSDPKSIMGYLLCLLGVIGILYFGFYMHIIEAAKGLMPH